MTTRIIMGIPRDEALEKLAETEAGRAALAQMARSTQRMLGHDIEHAEVVSYWQMRALLGLSADEAHGRQVLLEGAPYTSAEGTYLVDPETIPETLRAQSMTQAAASVQTDDESPLDRSPFLKALNEAKPPAQGRLVDLFAGDLAAKDGAK